MARRPKPTLMDYMVVGISPALIMAMVGSLLFYLLVVFYHGQFGGRLMFIFAMFTMAIVLIARISMEEGIEYATLFAIPLALVTIVAMSRFVQITGPLAQYSFLINVGLIALVWWSAHRLTWDCTLVDDSRDSSNEGLLQGMGFDGDTVESQANEQVEGSPDQSADSTSESQRTKAKKNGVPLWWQRMVDRRHRPHTPGVWVIYYALAALPLFALGQWLIPVNSSARLSAFRLLVVYVGSALGLLVTTSFLGLRRYLRQRKMEMPTDMASMWLGIGTIMILVILAFCVVLPRPGAAVKISQMPISFGSPDHERTNQNALGNDGPEQPQRATQTRDDAKESGPQAPTERGKQGKQSGSSEKQGSSASGKSQSQQGKEGKSGSSGSDKSKKSSGGQQDGGDSKSQGRSKDRNDSSGKAGGKSGEKRSGADQSNGNAKNRNKSGASGKANPKEGQRNPSQGKGAKSDGQPGEKRPNNQQSPGNRGGRSFERKQQENQNSKSQPSQKDGQKKQSSGSSSSGPSRVSRLLNGLASGFGALLKLLFWVALICIVAYFAWKHRERVMQAIRQLIEDLKNLLANLLGGKRESDESDNKEVAAQQRELHRPFASFGDPFASGGADRYTNEQLVRYTFEAMEAWARERACPRDEELTPLEFARRLAVDHPNLGVEAQQLADLYSRVAYGHERVSSDRRSVLKQLWRLMRSTAAMPAPPADMKSV